MFVLLRDYLKNLQKKENKENNKKQAKEDDVVKENLVEKRNIEQKEIKKKTQKQIKKEQKKQKKKEKKEKKKKPVTVYSVLFVLIFISVFISKNNLLTQSDVYLLYGNLQYDLKSNRYIINYDIENLWNDYRLSVGDNVCIPPLYDVNKPAIKNYNGLCVPGKVISAGNKVDIEYNLPKTITYQELKLYVSKDNLSKNMGKVRIEIRGSEKEYQITEIIPIN